MSKALAVCTIIVTVAHYGKSAKYSVTSSALLQEWNWALTQYTSHLMQ
jgi:hypothetical protein